VETTGRLSIHESENTALDYDREFLIDELFLSVLPRPPLGGPLCYDDWTLFSSTFEKHSQGQSRLHAGISSKRNFPIAREERLFEYQNYDYSDFVDKKIMPTMEVYFRRAAAEWCRCEMLLTKFSLSGCLVEEDFGSRANFCEYLKYANVPIFCISHGHGGFEFEPRRKSRVFGNPPHSPIQNMKRSRCIFREAGTGRGSRFPEHRVTINFTEASEAPPGSALPKRSFIAQEASQRVRRTTPAIWALIMVAYRSYQIKERSALF
jgi:hypothetical protein